MNSNIIKMTVMRITVDVDVCLSDIFTNVIASYLLVFLNNITIIHVSIYEFVGSSLFVLVQLKCSCIVQ